MDQKNKLKIANAKFDSILPETWKQAEENLKELEEKHSAAESLQQSLKEMKLIREGKMKRRTWQEIYDELKEEREDE